MADLGRAMKLALLFVGLCAVALGAYQPHWRAGEAPYPYPVHLDEYWHWGMGTAVLRTGAAEAPEPFSGPIMLDEPALPTYPTQIHERGYHTYLAALQGVTGLDWITLLQILPVATAVLTALVLFLIAERWQAGVPAVLWYAAAPTSLRFLGPGFAVPIAFALPMALLGLHLAAKATERRAWIAVLLLASALWPIHAMGALLLSLLVLAMLLVSGRSLRTALMAIAVALPFLLAWPYYLSGQSLATDPWLEPGLEALRQPGVALFIAAAIGGAWVAATRARQDRGVGIAISLVTIAALSVIWWRNAFGVDPLRLYDRASTSLGPLLAILAGAGTMAVAKVAARAHSRTFRRAPSLAGPIVLLLLIAQGAAVAGAFERNATQAYYLPLDDEKYASYVAAAEALHEFPGYALVDGTDTLAWTATTGMPTAWVQSPTAGRQPVVFEEFFGGGGQDVAFLIERDITVVVSSRPVDGEHLRELVPGVHILREDLLQRLHPGATYPHVDARPAAP